MSILSNSLLLLLLHFSLIFCLFPSTQADQDTLSNECDVLNTETVQQTDVKETEQKTTVEASIPNTEPQQTPIANAMPGIFCHRICLIFLLNY